MWILENKQWKEEREERITSLRYDVEGYEWIKELTF